MRKQLQRLLQQLSPNQQTEYTYIHVNQNEFVDKSTHLKRIIVHLPGNATNEEARKALAEAYGLPEEVFSHINFERRVPEIKAHKKKVSDVIESYKLFLNANGAVQDKHNELFDIGRFILAVNPQLEIVVPQIILEYPDFHITNGQQIVGVEHTRLIDERMMAAFKTIQYILKQAEDLLRPEFEAWSKTFNLFFNYSAQVSSQGNFLDGRMSQAEKLAIRDVVVQYVRSILAEKPIQRPTFIDYIQISDNKENQFHMQLSEKYMTSHAFIEQLLECMAKKEIKANKYRTVIPNSKLWLLIVVDDINSFSGFDLKATKLPKLSFSNFDRIFLFEKYEGAYYLLTED